jgi:hypothetical protein
MMGQNCITIIEDKNDILPGIPDTIELNFNDVKAGVVKYLELFSQEEVDLEFKESKIVVKEGRQKTNVHFCVDLLVTAFSGSAPTTLGDIVYSFDFSDDFKDIFDKVKKVAASFQKVYFTVSDGVLSIEATDKTNKFSNGLKIELDKVPYDDIRLCLDFRNFSNLLALVSSSEKNFKMNIHWLADKGAGMLSCLDEMKTEQYYLISQMEDSI